MKVSIRFGGRFVATTNEGLYKGSTTGNDEIMQENVLARLHSSLPSLSPALIRIAEYVLKDPKQVIYQTITEVADGSQASEASVLRFCRDIGFSSFQRFKLSLGIELSANQSSPPKRTTSGDLLDETISTAISALERTRELLDRAALDIAVKEILKARSIDLYGLGGSANIARYAHYSFVRLGLISRVFDDPHLAVMSAVSLGPKQVAIAISESGSSKNTISLLKTARTAGAFTIAITSHIRSPIVSVAHNVPCGVSHRHTDHARPILPNSRTVPDRRRSRRLDCQTRSRCEGSDAAQCRSGH